MKKASNIFWAVVSGIFLVQELLYFIKNGTVNNAFILALTFLILILSLRPFFRRQDMGNVQATTEIQPENNRLPLIRKINKIFINVGVPIFIFLFFMSLFSASFAVPISIFIIFIPFYLAFLSGSFVIDTKFSSSSTGRKVLIFTGVVLVTVFIFQILTSKIVSIISPELHSQISDLL